MSHSSGIDAKNFRSSARPDLFSKIDSDSSIGKIPDCKSGMSTESEIDFLFNIKVSTQPVDQKNGCLLTRYNNFTLLCYGGHNFIAQNTNFKIKLVLISSSISY